jgi:DNA-directed RNA polymerase subunit H (RpoH/RPB5)
MMADPLTHEKVPPHRVLTPPQSRALLKRLKLEPERLPTIPLNDAAIMALLTTTEVNVGDIVEIERTSISTGKKLYWRLVVLPEEISA